MTLQERIAAVIRKHLFTLYPGEIACDCEWTFGEAGSATSTEALLDAWAAHAAALAADGEAASEDGTCREHFAAHPTRPELVAVCTLPSGHQGEHDNVLPKPTGVVS